MSQLSPVPTGSLPPGAAPVEYPTAPPLAAPASPVPPGAVRRGVGWPGGDGPPAPPRPPVTGLTALAVAAVSVLLAGILAAATDGGGGLDVEAALTEAPARSGPPRIDLPEVLPTIPTLPPLPTEPTVPRPTPGTELADVVDELARFVAAERGLDFLRAVDVEVADVDDLDRRRTDAFVAEAELLLADARVYEALGLVEPGTDLGEAAALVLAGGVPAFWDAERGELLVGARVRATPYGRAILARELTHALEDQHFAGGGRGGGRGDDPEATVGVVALREGSARRIEEAYRATFLPFEEEDAAREEAEVRVPDELFTVPPVVVETLQAPYVLGPDLVAALLADGGQAALDAAFATPPTTSEQVLLPQAYVAGGVEAGAPAPPEVDADAPPVAEGTLGALGLATLLGRGAATVGGLPPAVDGWGADRYVAWADPDGSGACVRLGVVGDTAADTAEIADALARWAAEPPPGVTAMVVPVGPGAPVVLTSCSA